MELVGGGGKGLEEVTPVPRGIELEPIPVEGTTELGLTPVPKGREGDEVTPVSGKIELELIPVGGKTELDPTPVPRGIELEGPTPVPRGTEELLTGGTGTPLLVLENGGRTLLSLVPKNTELEEG